MPLPGRRLLPFFLVVVVLPLARAAADEPPAPSADAALAGLWETEKVLGRGAALWLAPNGDAVWGTGMFVDGTYTVHGDRIALRLELLPEGLDMDEPEAPQPQPMGRLTTTRWTREGNGVSETWERVGTSDRVTVEGTWTTTHRMGRPAYDRYEPGGTVRMRMQVGPGLAGTWVRKGDTVEMRWKDGTSSTAKVAGDALHVPSGADAVVLVRRGAENWYALRPDPPEFTAGRTPQSDREVPGLWENASKSLGGIGGAWWFEPSGRVLAATLILGDATYEKKDDRLVLRSADAPEPQETPLGELSPATWRTETEDVEVVKERLGPPVDPPSVVGVWRYTHYTGGTAYERYGEDGSMRFRLLLTPAEIGTWSRQGNVLEVRWPQSPAATFRVEGGRLFDDVGGRKEPYAVRRGDEDWYGLARGWGPEPSRAR